jgi:D-glycero-alpha-D-manno-heptose 1-phosphate guanylyltransferase
MIPAIVLAGGFGTRLAAVSGGVPKPMVEVAGRPFIEHVLDQLLEAGIERVILAVSYRWELLRDRIGESYRGASISYCVEGEPLGTGGAILKCFQEYGLERALILNGDTLFRVDLTELVASHTKEGASITMALRRLEDTARYGVVTCDASGSIDAFHEKSGNRPGLINGGIYVIERRVFDGVTLPVKFSFERDFLQQRVAELRPLAVTSDDAYFIDIGIPEDLRRARNELAINA